MNLILFVDDKVREPGELLKQGRAGGGDGEQDVQADAGDGGVRDGARDLREAASVAHREGAVPVPVRQRQAERGRDRQPPGHPPEDVPPAPPSLEREADIVRKIDIKSYKDSRNRLLEKEGDPKTDLITLSHYDFDHLIENVYNEKLPSGRPIFKCCAWMRKQDVRRGKEVVGEQAPFIPDQQYIDLKAIKQEIGDIRMLLEYPPPHAETSRR